MARLANTIDARMALAIAKAQVAQAAKEVERLTDDEAFVLLWQLGCVWLQKLEEFRVPE